VLVLDLPIAGMAADFFSCFFLSCILKLMIVQLLIVSSCRGLHMRMHALDPIKQVARMKIRDFMGMAYLQRGACAQYLILKLAPNCFACFLVCNSNLLVQLLYP
jgi:fumarate reductase subunit D